MALFPFEPIAACTLTLVCLGGPAQPAESSFQLSLHDVSGTSSSVSLNCEPAGGSHPESEAACAALGSVDGEFARLRPRPQSCALNYAPVDVAAIGNWRGRSVDFRTTYSNRCVASAQSAGVFGF